MSAPPPYQISIDGFSRDHFRVHAFTGKEAMSETWSFDVVVTAEAGGDAIERAALGQRAVLRFNIGEQQRAFYGIVAAVRLSQVHDADHTIKYNLRVVPRLWLLKRRKRTRIFQKMRVTDVVTAVLNEAGIATRWQLTRAYPMREYCTQYEETDYRFVQRLLAEAGIYFYFPTGPALDDAALAADTALGVAASAGSSLLGAVAGSEVAGLVGSAVSIGETLIPGDTVICADDASAYPPVNGDDGAALAASTAAALAPAVGDALGAGGGIAGAVIGTASAVAGTVIAEMSAAAHDVPVLRFLANEEARVSILDKLTRFSLRNSVRSTGAMFRDYDPERPMVRLQSSAVSTQPFPPSPFEAAAMAAAAAENAASAVESAIPLPGAAAEVIGTVGAVVDQAASVVNTVAGALGQKVPHEVYEHHSPFLFPKWSFANDEAPRILRQKRRRASIATGEGGCSDLSPGHRFSLRDHPAAHLDGTYVVTSVEHRGQTRPEPGKDWHVYWGAFECAPSEMAYVPPRPKRKSVQVALTATVVGPPGEDIHVDPLGQIKVQFHWDREGRHDENSSCWIRVLQPWAGAGWGHQFIPRIGQEVVVVFEGGDTDKPMVLGALYNGTHPPPFPLPAEKTRSGIRTQSSPRGGGFNELSFEDAAGKEQIHIHAQRNFDEVVERNHTLLVRNDEIIRVLANRIDTIEKNLEEHVHGDHKSHVEGNRLEVVAGSADKRVSGSLVTRVEGRERRTVQGMTDLEYADDVTTRVKGCSTTLVGKNDKKRSWVTHAEGTAELSSTDSTRVSSTGELVLGVGKSAIRITADKIELISGSISAKGGGAGLSASDDGLSLSSKGDAKMVVGKKLVMKSDGATLSMEKEMKLAGTKILLNSPATAKDAPAEEPKPPTKIEVLDESGVPLAHARFLAVLDDGSEVSGFTDKDGKVELDLPSGGKITFPDLDNIQPG